MEGPLTRPGTALWAPLLLAAAACGAATAEEASAAPPAPAPAAEAEEALRARLRGADEAGDWETCAALRRELLRLHPDDAGLRVDLADDLQRCGRGDEGAAVLEEIAAADATRDLALRALCELRWRDGRPLDAAAALERLAAAGPRDQRDLWRRAAELREEGGDLAGALAALERALEGLEIPESERRTLERLQAFETGEIHNVADAVALLQLHPDARKRLLGIQYLARGRFPDDLQVFRRALSDPDPPVYRLAAMEFCARASAAEAAEVAELVQHADEDVRLAAARALGRIGTRAEVPALIRAMDPQNRTLWRAVRLSLERLTGQTIGVELDPDAARRGEIRAAWEAWWAERQAEGRP